MKLSVAKSTLAVMAAALLVGGATVAGAQTIHLRHAYSTAAGEVSASPTNFITVYGARVEGAAAFEIRSIAWRVFYDNTNTPNSFEVTAGRETSIFSKTFNGGLDATNVDGNDATNQFGVANPIFTAGYPLGTNANTIPVGWNPGDPTNGAFEPLLVVGFPGVPNPSAFGITGNPPTASGIVIRDPGSTATGAFIANTNTVGLSNTEGEFVLAVEMASLDAKATGNGVLVTWETAMEIDNAGFNVYSQPEVATGLTKLNPILIGAAGTAASYSFADSRPLANGEVRAYYVEDVDVTGLATTLHGPAIVQGGVSSNVPSWDLY